MSGEPRKRGSASAETARAQTPIDFAIGASVFLLTLAFVVAFVPTLFDPFTAADTASPLVSDRVAAGMAGDVLAASPAEPGVLSPACTVAFFESNGSLATDAGCDGVTESPADRFGIDGDVQVVIHALNETQPRGNASTLTIPTRHGTFEGVELSRSTDGGGATGGDDVTVSRRLVSLDGAQYRLTVRVW